MVVLQGNKIAIYIIIFFKITLSLFGKNPILPPTAFIPDGEPRIFEYKGEPRVFLYGSRDERVHAYCGFGHDAWSAPVKDLSKWTNHGEIFNVKQVQDIGYGKVPNQHFGAPDCVYNPVTGKYYLYTFLGGYYKMDGKQGPAPGSKNYVPGYGQAGPKCVMAQSDSPAGPFTDPVICDWPPANDRGAFDPAALVDVQPDGSIKVYVYWGMVEGDRWAQVDPTDMHSIIDPKTREPDRNAWHKTLDPNSPVTFFEASSVRKVANNKYVFICSSMQKPSALTYFYGTSPEGPWKLGGEIVDNCQNWKGGNNHGSIANINGKWYVFYHRQTTNNYNRQAMAEPIEMRIESDKVIIPPVEMTSEGFQTDGLDAFERYNAYVICWLNAPYPYIDGQQRNADGLNPMVNISSGSVLGIKYLNFGDVAVTDADKLVIRLYAKLLKENTCISILVSKPDQVNLETKKIKLAKFKLSDYVPLDKKFHEVILPVKGLDNNSALQDIGGLKGKLAIFFTFEGRKGELFELKEWQFCKTKKLSSN